MTQLLTARQTRATEGANIESGKVTGLQLMERAGAGVVEMTFDAWPYLRSSASSAAVLCGPGNNGGDGYVVARLLYGLGWRVSVYAYGDPEKLPPDAHVNYRRWIDRGSVRPLSEVVDAVRVDSVDLIVDSVFGTGLVRPLGNDLISMIEAVRDFGESVGTSPIVVSVDIPSGICSDSGRELGGAFTSDLTVTFHTAKPGHYLGEGPYRCGSLRVVDIGLGEDICPEAVEIVRRPTRLDKGRRVAAHKFHNGHLLVLSGGVGKGGAARLAALGALRIGAGLVSVGCPPSALQENAVHLNAVMVRSVVSGKALSDFVDRDSRVTALCLGPGLGIGERERELVRVALLSGRSLVLDADALTLLASEHSLFNALHERCVLTPHGGEFSRLFPDIAAHIGAEPTAGPAFSKVDATREAAARAGCTVLFKGPDTVIATPDGCVAVNAAFYDRSVPWLATAGSGDVLAGLVAGLLARGFDTRYAAMTASYVHVACALRFGPGLISEDLPDGVPSVLRELID